MSLGEHCDQVGHWVDEERIVCYQFIAKELCVGHEEAKLVLEEMRKRIDGLTFIYFLSGIDMNGLRVVKLVNLERRDEEVLKLKEVYSNHIYSVQKILPSYVNFSSDRREVSRSEICKKELSSKGIKTEGSFVIDQSILNLLTDDVKQDQKMDVTHEDTVTHEDIVKPQIKKEEQSVDKGIVNMNDQIIKEQTESILKLFDDDDNMESDDKENQKMVDPPVNKTPEKGTKQKSEDQKNPKKQNGSTKKKLEDQKNTKKQPKKSQQGQPGKQTSILSFFSKKKHKL